MASTLGSNGSSHLLKRKRKEASTTDFGQTCVKKLKAGEVEDPEEQLRLRMRKARQLKQHNRAMGYPVNRGVNQLMKGSVPLATAIQALDAPIMNQSKAKSMAKAKTHAGFTAADRSESQMSAGRARVANSTSDTISANEFAYKSTSTQVRVKRNTVPTPEGMALSTNKSKPKNKGLEKQNSARSVHKSKKERSKKPNKAAKNEKTSSKAQSTKGLDPTNGSLVGSQRKAEAVKATEAKEMKPIGDFNPNTSPETSTYGSQEQQQRQLGLLLRKAAKIQESNETESSSSEMSLSSMMNPEAANASQPTSLNRCRLFNHGHSSYFNAVIQALYGWKDFVDYCSDVDADVVTCGQIDVKYKDMVAVLGASGLDRNELSAKRVALKEAFDSVKEQYNCAAQLAVYFRFMQILQRVDLAFLMNVVGSLTALPAADFQGYNGECPEDVAEFLISLLNVLMNEGEGHDAVHSLLGEITIAREVKCTGCGRVSVDYAPICSPLGLDIPSNLPEVTLSDLLDLYTARSKATEHECKSEGCRQQTEAQANARLGKIADCLIIEVKHSNKELDDAPPLFTQLRVPTEPIDLSVWSQHSEGEPSASRWYHARSIVLRSLTENDRDHYTTLRREDGNTWVHLDDDKEPIEVSPADMVIGNYEVSLIFMERTA